MPIFTTAVSGSGTNRSAGLSQGGVAAHFTGSLHVFSGSWSGQRALNITGSVAASSDILVGGDIKTFEKLGNYGDAVHTAISIEKGVATPKVTLAGDLQIGGNDIFDSGGASAVAFDGSQNTEIKGNLQVDGNIAGDADESKTIFAESTSVGSTITIGGGGLFIAGGDVQVNGNDIKDSGGNNQITFSAGSQASFAYDIDVTGTGSAAAFQIGTDTDGNRAPDAGYPFRVSNEHGDVGINIDSKNNKVASLLFSENGHDVGAGWFVDYGANTKNRASFRRSSDDQGQGAIVIHDTMKTVRIGGGDISGDSYDDTASLLVTSSAYNRPSMLRLRTKHGSRSPQAYPVISWMHETAASNNTGHWAMGIDPTSVGDGDTAGEYLRITATGPGSSTMTAGTVSMTFRAGGSDASVGIGGDTSGRQLIPTGTLHLENGRTESYSLTQDLEKAQLFVGNCANSTGEITAGMWMDTSNDPDIEKHTAHILAVNTDTRAGHKGYLSVGLYDGSGNVNSTRSRLRIDDQGAALFISASRSIAGGGYPRNADNYYDISAMDVPSGSITAISLMDGTYGKDPATINLVSWKGSTGNKGTVTAGDNLGRIAWVSNDSDFASTSEDNDERGKAVAAYIESIATEAHSDANNAPGNMDFYVRGSGQATPQKMLTLQTGSVELTGSLWIEHDIIVPQGGAIRDKKKNIFMSFGPGAALAGPGAAFPNGEVRFNQDVRISGTTPTLTIGDGGTEDCKLLYNGSAADFYVGVDDTDDKLHIGLGSVVGTTPNMTFSSSNRDVQFAGDVMVGGNNIYDSGGNVAITFDGSQNTTLAGNLVIPDSILHADDIDTKMVFGTNTQTYTCNSSERLKMNATGIGLMGATPIAGLAVTGDIETSTNVTVGDGNIYAAAGQTLGLNSPHHVIVKLDTDNNGSCKFQIDNGLGAEVLSVDEVGTLEISGDLQVDGNVIRASDGGSTITMDTSDNVTIGGGLRINGNGIKDSGGNTPISFDGSGNIDGLGNIEVDVSIVGSTPTLTIGDGGNEDVKVLFNSDVNDYYIGSDATDDTLNLGVGSTVGTTSAMRITSGSLVEFPYGVNISTAVNISPSVPTGAGYWLPILGVVDSTNSDQSTGVYLVTLTGNDRAGATAEADWQFIVNLRYGIHGPTADPDATSITVEQLNTSILGSSVTAFDPTTDIKIACNGGDDARLWIKSPNSYKACFVSCLGGGLSQDAATNIYLDAAWKILNDQSWQSAEPVGTSTNWYGVWASKSFTKVTAPTFAGVGDITLDAVGDIILSAPGEQIEMTNGTTTRLTFNVDSTPEIDFFGAARIDCDSTLELECEGSMLCDINSNGHFRVSLTSATSYGFEVHDDGHFYAQSLSSNGGTNYMRYDTGTGEISYTTSTEKVKENIRDLPLDYAPLLAMQPRIFDYKTAQGGNKNIVGFVAEEMVGAHPASVALGPDWDYDEDGYVKLIDAVREEDGEPTKAKVLLSENKVPIAWDDAATTAYLVKIIQDLHARIQDLENS